MEDPREHYFVLDILHREGEKKELEALAAKLSLSQLLSRSCGGDSFATTNSMLGILHDTTRPRLCSVVNEGMLNLVNLYLNSI